MTDHSSANERDERFYFRQLLSGRDFAVGDPLAAQMRNFVYVIGDREAGEAVVIDPAYDPLGVVELVENDGLTVIGALATHYHPDHVGGPMMGFDIMGCRELLEQRSVPVHVHAADAEFVRQVTGLGESDLIAHHSGDHLEVGAVRVELIHTPGHTPGSQCFLVDGRLLAGDTLFLDGCGRTDLPGGDPAQLYESLTQRLAKVPDTATLYPGHLYSPSASASMGHTRQHNFVFVPKSAEQWLAMFG
jgi:glyoxylase-like metal-dependent hydrolase (beta-lactamase superfamily II)